MDKFIDRQKLEAHFLPAITGKDAYTAGEVLLSIQKFPSADVAPVIHAHWVRWKEPKVTNPVYKCSNCGFDITVDKHPNVSVGFWIDDFRYCLCCGAKMDEVEQ